MNTAIIVAAGSGTRFGSEKPKQFFDLKGKPVVFHSVARFQECPEIDAIVLVLAEGDIKKTLPEAEKYSKLKSVVVGGTSRAESVRNGLRAAHRDGIVAVHDGARPLVSVKDISNTIKAAEQTGAACLVIPVTDTIKKVSKEGFIEVTVDRSGLRRAVTPQCFEYQILSDAFGEVTDLKDFTDESSLVEASGTKVRTVEGSEKNIKITVLHDLKIAELLLNKEEDK